MDGFMFGESQEIGFWMSRVSRWRFMWKGHDSLYVAAWRLRFRVMKPAWLAERVEVGRG